MALPAVALTSETSLHPAIAPHHPRPEQRLSNRKLFSLDFRIVRATGEFSVFRLPVKLAGEQVLVTPSYLNKPLKTQ
jgi:hypothetical protein